MPPRAPPLQVHNGRPVERVNRLAPRAFGGILLRLPPPVVSLPSRRRGLRRFASHRNAEPLPLHRAHHPHQQSNRCTDEQQPLQRSAKPWRSRSDAINTKEDPHNQAKDLGLHAIPPGRLGPLELLAGQYLSNLRLRLCKLRLLRCRQTRSANPVSSRRRERGLLRCTRLCCSTESARAQCRHEHPRPHTIDHAILMITAPKHRPPARLAATRAELRCLPWRLFPQASTEDRIHPAARADRSTPATNRSTSPESRLSVRRSSPVGLPPAAARAALP